MCSHPNPQHDYGENEIGTPMKPSERIEEIVNKNTNYYFDGDDTLRTILNDCGKSERIILDSIIEYLDEQAGKGK